MSHRLMHSGSSHNGLVDDGGSPSDNMEGSISVKGSTSPTSLKNCDGLSPLQKPHFRNSRPSALDDGDSITISSDSESSLSKVESKQKHPDSVVTERVVNSNSSFDANHQHLTTAPVVDDEVMILSSSSSPEKNFAVQLQGIDSSGSSEETKTKQSKPLDTLNERECLVIVSPCASSFTQNVPSLNLERLERTYSSLDEENSKKSGLKSKASKKEEEAEDADRKSVMRRRKIAFSESDEESKKEPREENRLIGTTTNEGKSNVANLESKHATIFGSTKTNRRIKCTLRRRKIVSSESDEESKKETREENGSTGTQTENEEVEAKAVKSKRKRERPLKYRLRRHKSSSYCSNSNSSGSASSNDRSSLAEFRPNEGSKVKIKKEAKEKAKIGHIEAEERMEESDDADDMDGKKGRRKIRRILKDKKLSSETKNAESLERERRKRLEERQKLYNSMLEDASEGSTYKCSRLVFDFKKDSEEPLVEVHPDLVRHLKPHQVQAARFLYDNIIESVEEHNNNRDRLSGAILAHCMGLGKSLSAIAFIHALLTNKEAGLGLTTCLILCPVNTLLNWHREWRHWMPDDVEVNVYELATAAANNFRIDVIRHWHSEGGILIMGYDMYRNITTSLLKKTRKQAYKKLIPAALIDPGPDIVVCDEGHLLKNCKTGVAKAINSLKTPKRIILTGTPLQNNLSEYWTMVNFVKPNLLGSAREFANRFVNPIKNGQHLNSTERDVQLMKKRSHVLFKTLDGCVQRKDYSCLTQYLPPRLEYVLKIRLSDVQCELYRAFLQHRLEKDASGGGDDQRNTLFRDQQTLYRVCTHPYTLRMHETREARRLLLEDSSSEDEEKEDDDEESSIDVSGSNSDSGEAVNSRSESASSRSDIIETKITTASSRSTRAQLRQLRGTTRIVEISNSGDDTNQQSSVAMGEGLGYEKRIGNSMDKESDNDLLKPWWYPFYRDEYDLRIDVGAKLSALFFILKKCSEIGDKVLIFSQSLFSLDLIEWFLAAIDRQWCMSQGLQADTNSKQSQELDKLFRLETFQMPSLVEYFSDMDQNTWRRGHDYERIDGSLSAVQRNSLQTRFNNPSQRFRLLIISTKAGGLGVNLTAANRLIIFDVSWNPSHDVQSIFRSYRFGQSKPVYIYRMVAQGTMEEKMYDRQVTKQSLALRVIDEQQIDRHFKEEDLRELYTFEPDAWDVDSAGKRPPLVLPKDRLLADLLSDHPSLVANYHNHDSLLENRLDEGLSEAEQAEAWREYEEEKRVGRPMTDYQRLLLNDPEAAGALMAQRQRFEEEQRQRMMAMAAYAAATAGNRMPYASINPSPLGLIDSMYTTVPAHTLPVQRPEPLFPSRLPPPQHQRDILSESFNAMRDMLVTRYPLLARSPSTLHDMAVRLFVNSVANNVATQSTLSGAQAVATASSSSTAGMAHQPTPKLSESVFSTTTTTPMVVDVDTESNDDA